MEKQTLSLLGLPKKLNNVGAPTDFYLRDPFMSTMNDLVVFCLSELSNVLHLVVTHTYKQLPKKKGETFYLIGYKPRSGWVNMQQKIYGDPTVCTEGQQIKWLLKNLRWYWKKYAEYMELDDEAFDDITGFLLFDVVQNAYSDCETQMKNPNDEDLTEHCFQASLDLVIAICESDHFKHIREIVNKYKENIETMYNMITEFKCFQAKQEESHSEMLDTSKVIKFLQNDALVSELKKEEMQGDSPVDKPITNFFLFSVIPRFEHLFSTSNDSGIITDPLDPLLNQTVDGSMIVINSFTSTPIPKPKAMKNPILQTLKEAETDTTDICEGSFVVI